MISIARAPLFLQALGLVIATLVAAQIAAVVVLLSLPPPPPDVYSVSDVAAAVRDRGAPAMAERRALTARIEDHPPGGRTWGNRRLAFRAALAGVLGIDPSRVVVTQPGIRIIAFDGDRRRPSRDRAIGAAQPILLDDFAVEVRQGNGQWLVVQTRASLGLDPWRARILLVLGLAAVAVSPLAWWFARRLAAPMAAFAIAAERLGRDPKADPLVLGGPSEMAAAVRAFNRMQELLAKYVEDRTTMIGAIAHDLRTPLTRLRFRIEGASDPLRAKMAADIEEMESMVSATLAFVKDQARGGAHTRLDIASVVETVVDEAAETGADAAIEQADRVVVDGDPLALKRLLANLVHNSVKFGARARVRIFQQGAAAIVEIDDDGPGMANADMERAFEPFRRLETSRSRDTGGIGLG
ncbi:MAG: ATP-binding protein, partial [Caulobacteraceae bacterium]